MVVPNLDRLTRKSLADDITEKLAELIASGQLKPGDKLPPERELMKLFGVGRSSVREAIGALELVGVLTVRPGSGTHVALSPEGFLARPLSWGMPVRQGKLAELIEARLFVEEAIAGLAAERATEADITVIRRREAAHSTCQGSSRKRAEADLAFHSALAAASHNQVLAGFLAKIHYPNRSWVEQAQQVAGVYELARREHAAILIAVLAHDPEEARGAMRRHMRTVGEALLDRVLGQPSQSRSAWEERAV